MVDLTGLTDEQLKKVYQSTAPDAPDDSNDVSKLSDADLVKLYKQAGGENYSRAWRDVPGEALRNLPSNLYEKASDIGGAALRSVESYSPWGPLAPLKATFDAERFVYNNPDVIKNAPKAAWDALVNRYGSEEAVKRTLATDPVGVALDLSTVASLGETGLGRLGLIGRGVRPPPLPSMLTPEAAPVAEASQRLGVPVPKAVGSESMPVQSAGQAMSYAPIIGTPVRRAIEQLPEDLGAAAEKVAKEHGSGTQANVGGAISEHLGDTAAQEAQAAQAAAAQTDDARLADWEKANQAREQAIHDQRAQSAQQARQTFGDVDPNEMGEDAIAAVQGAEGQARRAKEARYDRVNDLDAQVSKEAFSDVAPRAQAALNDAGFTIDPKLHPNAMSMMGEFNRLTGRPAEIPPNVPKNVVAALQKAYGDNIPPEAWKAVGVDAADIGEAVEPDFRLMGRHAPASDAPDVSIQGVEQLRKRVGQMAFNATDDADRHASNILKNAFDDWYEHATENHLTGDANALDTIREARAANADWRNRFGYNYASFPAGGERRNAARMLNRMVTGDAGPEEVARQLIGAKPGTRPVSAPLYDAISGAVTDQNALRNNVRGAYWNRIAPEGRSPKLVAGDIDGLRTTRMGDRLFEAGEHDMMQRHGDLLQRTPEDLRQAAAEAKASKPQPTKVEPGEAQQLAKRVMKGGRSDEQVFNAIDQMAQSKGKADIATLGKLWTSLPQQAKADHAAAVIRKMGGGDKFSPNTFATNWENYTPQAKTLMFGNAGPHRQALEDIYTISKRYQDVYKKFGNPSGTGQINNWRDLAKSVLKVGAAGVSYLHPIGALTTALGGVGVAKLLASPVGAPSVSRWARIAEATQRSATPTNIARMYRATSDVASTGRALGLATDHLTKQ